METELIARAYKPAAEYSDLEDLRSKLRREEYWSVDAHLSSRQLRGELKLLLKSDGS